VPVPPRARSLRPVTRWLLPLAMVAAVGAAALSLPAVATPRPTQADVDRLGEQVSRLDEQLNQARIELDQLRRLAGQAAQAAAVQQRRLDTVRRAVAAQAVARYQGASLGQVASLLSGEDSTTMLEKAETLDLLAQRDGDLLASAAIQRHAVATATAELARARAAQQAEVDRIAGRKAQLERKLAQLQRVRTQVGDPRSVALPVPLPPASGAAAIAVRTALAQVGKPYHWGSAGPDAFDCSGLTMYAWRAAGVSLPHSSSAQYQSLPHIGRASLQPGDLVFFGSPIHHVGIYVGAGVMVAAPSSGRVVQVQNIDRSDYVGAGRP
jgi:cell wall-associated NlpC family hydrolase